MEGCGGMAERLATCCSGADGRLAGLLITTGIVHPACNLSLSKHTRLASPWHGIPTRGARHAPVAVRQAVSWHGPFSRAQAHGCHMSGSVPVPLQGGRSQSSEIGSGSGGMLRQGGRRKTHHGSINITRSQISERKTRITRRCELHKRRRARCERWSSHKPHSFPQKKQILHKAFVTLSLRL